MSGSEHERQLIETGTHSAAPAIKSANVKDTAIKPELHTYRPPALGLYDPSQEKDACGVGFIANIKGRSRIRSSADAISILCNLEHRGAVGADPRFGDGAGILVQIRTSSSSARRRSSASALPEPGEYAIGALFMPRDTAMAQSHSGHHRRPDQGRRPDAARLA
jgi:glutamate synthase (NADPH/NADH) large chain